MVGVQTPAHRRQPHRQGAQGGVQTLDLDLDHRVAVGLTGQVQSVAIPALSGTNLGSCLESFIRRWKFPRTTEVFSGKFPVVFSAAR